MITSLYIRPSLFRFLGGLLLCFLMTGCGGADAPPPEQSEIGGQVKISVEDFLKTARTAPNRAASEITILLESLNAMADEHGEPFIAVRDQALAVEAKYKSSSPKSEIETEIEKLEQLVANLPGS